MFALSGLQPYVVVPDVNIYLSAAYELGAGFTVEQFYDRVRQSKFVDMDVFSFFASVLQPYPDGSPIEVWSGWHIVETAMYKATQSEVGMKPEDRGYGWGKSESTSISDLIADLTIRTGGHITKKNGAYRNPPLDYEDGCVMRCVADSHPSSVLCHKFCITSDIGMIKDMRNDYTANVVSLQDWLFMIRKTKAAKSFKEMANSAQH